MLAAAATPAVNDHRRPSASPTSARSSATSKAPSAVIYAAAGQLAADADLVRIHQPGAAPPAGGEAARSRRRSARLSITAVVVGIIRVVGWADQQDGEEVQ